MATKTIELRNTATAAAPKSFRYLCDPVFLASMVLYALNRWFLKPDVGGWFFRDYFNDVLCLPLLLPVILKMQSSLRIRRHNAPPTLFEVLHNWAVFTVVYEIFLPRLTMFDSVSDPWDSVAYLVGGLLTYAIWNQGDLRFRHLFMPSARRDALAIA